MHHKYTLYRGSIIAVEGDRRILDAVQQIQTSIGPNQIPIPSPFTGTMPRDTDYRINPGILEPYKQWDMIYFTHYCGLYYDREWYEKNIWKQCVYGKVTYSGIKWDTPASTSLLIRSLRESSFYNKSFAGILIDRDGEKKAMYYSAYSQENLYPTKIVKLLSRYNKPTHVLPPLMKECRHVIPLAIDMMATLS